MQVAYPVQVMLAFLFLPEQIVSLKHPLRSLL